MLFCVVILVTLQNVYVCHDFIARGLLRHPFHRNRSWGSRRRREQIISRIKVFKFHYPNQRQGDEVFREAETKELQDENFSTAWLQFLQNENESSSGEKQYEKDDIQPNLDIEQQRHNFSFDRSDICRICLCEYQDGDILCMLNCHHVYHKNCLWPWFENHLVCPACKQSLNGDS
mmetsp:Transcript_40982/g.52806  ORF Transcript_40982/g.52806 Transcript_40982/m.52806 type:complete len:175 (-) Transcript_40982:73-597(-)